MSDRRAVIIAVAWILGVAWILIPHPLEGPVLWVISAHYEIGVHLTDPLGIGGPAAVTTALWRRSVNG